MSLEIIDGVLIYVPERKYLMANKCTWCSSIGTMSKHPDKDRAKEGITRCSVCNMCHSPNAPIKGSYAYWDGSKIITGIRGMVNSKGVVS